MRWKNISPYGRKNSSRTKVRGLKKRRKRENAWRKSIFLPPTDCITIIIMLRANAPRCGAAHSFFRLSSDCCVIKRRFCGLRILFHGLTVCSAWKKRNKKRCISGDIPIVGHPIIFWRMPRQKPWARKKQRNESRFAILKRCLPSLKKAADSGKNTTPSAAARLP